MKTLIKKFVAGLKISVVVMSAFLYPIQPAISSDICEITPDTINYYQSFGCCYWSSGISCGEWLCSCFDDEKIN